MAQKYALFVFSDILILKRLHLKTQKLIRNGGEK